MQGKPGIHHLAALAVPCAGAPWTLVSTTGTTETRMQRHVIASSFYVHTRVVLRISYRIKPHLHIARAQCFTWYTMHVLTTSGRSALRSRQRHSSHIAIQMARDCQSVVSFESSLQLPRPQSGPRASSRTCRHSLHMPRCMICPAKANGRSAAAATVVQPACRSPEWSCRMAWCSGSIQSLTQETTSPPTCRPSVCSAVPDTAAVREVGVQSHVKANAVLDLAKASPNEIQPATHKPMIGAIPDSILIVSLAVAQAITLTGSLVGGNLARKRR